MIHVSIIDDDSDLRDFLETYFKQKKYQVTVYISAQEAFCHPKELEKSSVIICDLMMEGMSGIDFVKATQEWQLPVPIILITTSKEVEYAIEAIENGAFDYAIKPLHLEQLSIVVNRAARFSKLHLENEGLKSALEIQNSSIPLFLGKSPSLARVTAHARRVAKSSSSLLITGESGTGKDVLARSIHLMSDRSKGPFVAINCSAIPNNLLESELFGHTKGAFTGAVDKKIGLFEEATGGTLFLDEIGDMNYQLQSKILRVLQDRKIRRLGENQDIDIDVRIISATHKNLEVLIAEKKFREDLYYRLNVIPLHIPPLRQRIEDIVPLTNLFLKKYSQINGNKITSITKNAYEYLCQYSWPGNVRELENAIERAIILCDGNQIEESDLNINSNKFPAEESQALLERSRDSEEMIINPSTPPVTSAFFSIDRQMILDELTNEYIKFLLELNGNSKERTYRDLGIDRKTLYRKLEQINNSSENLH